MLPVLTSDSQRKKLMEYLRLDLAAVNIELSYEFLALSDYLTLVEEAGQMGSIMSWTSNADPDSALTQLYSKAGHPIKCRVDRHPPLSNTPPHIP